MISRRRGLLQNIVHNSVRFTGEGGGSGEGVLLSEEWQVKESEKLVIHRTTMSFNPLLDAKTTN